MNANSLPVMVRPTLPASFTSKMDGVSVSRFVNQIYNYFKIFELNNDIKMGYIAIMLLEGTDYNWFAV